MNNTQKIIAVVGPTASGKSALAVKIATKLNTEVISCDSMQIYKGMDIGTAKITQEEMQSIPHHLIDFVEPSQNYSVSDYIEDATKVCNSLFEQNKTPIFAGGTGLYLRSFLFGINFNQNSKNDEIRINLEKEVEQGNADLLFQELQKLDIKASENIHVNNHKRLIRALEYIKTTGELFSEQSIVNDAKYEHILICLTYKDREKLYEKINKRVDIMLESGLLEEAKYYKNKNLSTSAQAIGYKELFPYFENNIDLQTAIENIKRETRRYAKRQLTWFKAQPNTKWFFIDEYSNQEELIADVFKYVFEFLN